MVVKISNALATAILLRPTFAGKFTVLSTPSLVLHIKSGSGRYDFHTFAVSSKDYLESSLSLSPDSAEALHIIKHKPYPIRSTDKADSVVALLKDYGFSETQMAKIFSSFPELLTNNPVKILKPKLDFISGSGIPAAALIAANPYILKRSLRRVIVPCVSLLLSLFNNDHRALASFLLKKRAVRVFIRFSETETPANVETLRRLGVPDSNIARIAFVSSTLCLNSRYFSECAMEIKKMGFDPQGLGFVNGLQIRASMSKEKWKAKVELLKKCFGWSDDHQVVALFMKYNNVMALSEEKLMRGFQMLANRLGYTPDDIAKYPALLASSFENRILPRFSVLEILLSKGIINKMAFGRAFIIPEGAFLDVFVEKHQEGLPQLMEIYTKNKGLKIED